MFRKLEDKFGKEKITTLKQFIKYGIIGGICAGLDYFLSILIHSSLGINDFIANFIGVNSGIALSFILNTFLNFKQTDDIWRKALSFFGIGYFGLALSTGIIWIGNQLSLDFKISKLVSTVVVALIQFVLNKLITYRTEKGEEESKNG